MDQSSNPSIQQSNAPIFQYSDISASPNHPFSLSQTFVVLDSINAVMTKTSTSAPGSPSNIVKTLNVLHTLRTKHKELTVLIVGHANKQGKIAGPLTLQHMVDTVLLLEIDKSNSRILTTLKNRFGPSGIKTSFDLQSFIQHS